MPRSDPVLGITTPLGTEPPDGAANMAALVDQVVPRLVMRFASTAARDAAIAVGDREAGMVAFVDALGCWTGVLADGGPWKLLPLGRAVYDVGQSAVFNFTTGFTSIPGCSVTVPAGQWVVTGTGYGRVSTAAPEIYFLDVHDGVNGYFTSIEAGTSFRIPWTVQMRVDYAAATTVQLRGYVSSTSGVQLVENARLIVTPGMW